VKTTKLKGCIRCGGALNLTQDEPFCLTCGWVSWDDETHEVRRTATKRAKARLGRQRGYRLPHKGRSGPQGSVSLTVVTTNTAAMAYPLCPWCLERMAPGWAPNTPPTAKAYMCKTGHGVRIHHNKNGEHENWTVVPGSTKTDWGE